MHSKSMDWFLYDNDPRHERVNNNHSKVNLNTMIIVKIHNKTTKP